MVNLLLIEDDLPFGKMIQNFLSRNSYHVTIAYNGATAWQYCQDNSFQIILCDLRLPDSNGIDLMTQIKTIIPEIPFVLMTGYADVSTAVTAIKKGAADYISKPFVPEEMLLILENAIQNQQKSKKQKPSSIKSISNETLFGNSVASLQLKEHIQLVGPTDLSVLITGESGTGKEIVAKLIHEQSSRNKQNFIAVDCGSIPKDLASSEFFGHLKGSFTGAISDKIGSFEAANGGTLFLDEIGNLSYENQIQLLRALQERKIKKIGSNSEIKVDIRVLAATNEDLKEAVKKGTFREDLYHRLNEFSIKILPLRERKEDIVLYAEFFLTKANEQLNKNIIGFSSDVIRLFLNNAWQGNLRELQNCIKRATLLTKGNIIEKEVIPSDFWEVKSVSSTSGLSKSEVEKEAILKALNLCNGNKSEAAKLLEMNRKTLYNKLKAYGIE
jgi:two-component system response regulator HydG